MKISRRAIWLTVLGVVAYLLFLLPSLPAAQAWRLLEGQVPARVFGLGGTIWDGQAAVVIQGNRRLEAVQWDLQPSRLLLGELGANVRARLPGGRIRTDAVVSPGGFTARDLRLEMPAADLVKWAGMTQLPVRVDGQFDALMRELEVEGKLLQRADGLVSWNNAVVRFGSAPLPLGNMALRLEPATGGTNGTLSNDGSPIDIGGTLRLSPDGRFVMDLAVQVVGEVDDAKTLTAMKLLGIPADGSKVNARLTGALDGSGMKLSPVKK